MSKRKVTLYLSAEQFEKVDELRREVPFTKYAQELLALGLTMLTDDVSRDTDVDQAKILGKIADLKATIDPKLEANQKALESRMDGFDQALSKHMAMLNSAMDHREGLYRAQLRTLQDAQASIAVSITKHVYDVLTRSTRDVFTEAIFATLQPIFHQLRADMALLDELTMAGKQYATNTYERTCELFSQFQFELNADIDKRLGAMDRVLNETSQEVQSILNSTQYELTNVSAALTNVNDGLRDTTNAVLIGTEKAVAGTRTTLTQSVGELGHIIIARTSFMLDLLQPQNKASHDRNRLADIEALDEIVTDVKKRHALVVGATDKKLRQQFEAADVAEDIRKARRSLEVNVNEEF